MPTPHQDPIVIVGAARTPMGAFQGDFSTSLRTTWAALPSRPPWRAAGVAPRRWTKCCSATA